MTESLKPTVSHELHAQGESVHTNEATHTSDQFLAKKKKGFLHALGTFFRTTATEALTYIGAPLVPLGLLTATTFILGRDFIKGVGVKKVLETYPPNSIPVSDINSAFDSAINIGAGTSVAVSALGLGMTALGTAIGWGGAKQTVEGKKWFKWGKIAEFAAIPASIFLPVIYPIAKAFSIGATAYSVHRRP